MVLIILFYATPSAWEGSTSNSKPLSVSSDPHSLLWIVLVVCYNYHRVGWLLLSILAYLLWNNVVSRYSMIIIMNLSILILHNVVSSFAQRFNYWPRLTQSWCILLCFFSKKKMNMSISHKLRVDRRKKTIRNKFLLLDALNGQILKICIVKICFCRHIGAMWLSFIWLPVKNMQKWYIIIIFNWVYFWTCY